MTAIALAPAMRSRDVAVAIIVALATCASAPRAQSQRVVPRGPFVAGAAMAGALSFSNALETSALGGGYAYAAFSRLLVGAQGGTTLGGIGTRVGYGLATIGYPTRTADGRRLYGFVGLGQGQLRAPTAQSDRGVIVGAGFGFDRLVRQERGLITGMRVGYLRRAGKAGEPAVYVAVSAGAGGRRAVREPPPPIVASRN